MKKLIFMFVLGLVFSSCKKDSIEPKPEFDLHVKFIPYEEGVALLKKYDPAFVSDANHQPYIVYFTLSTRFSNLSAYKWDKFSRNELSLNGCFFEQGSNIGNCNAIVNEKTTRLLGGWQKQSDGSYQHHGLVFVDRPDSRWPTMDALNKAKSPYISAIFSGGLVRHTDVDNIKVLASWRP